MDNKWKKKAEIGIARIRNASEIQQKMVNRLHTINAVESDEAWIKELDVLADCILASSYEIQRAARKIKNAAAKIDDTDDLSWESGSEINVFNKNQEA